MKVWEALVTMTAARYNLDDEELEAALPELERGAKKSLRELGTTMEEMEDEFPDRALYDGLMLIKRDPNEFRRQAQIAMMEIIGRN